MLRLNPNDNQGNRYMLARLYLAEGMDKELGKLLKKYDEEGSAEWLYTRALWFYRTKGDTREAREALIEALEQNRFVPMYMCGFKEPPRKMPQYISRGDDSEALHYIVEHLEFWLETPGALEWFIAIFAQIVEEFKKSEMIQ